jgi:hypothetical protein
VGQHGEQRGLVTMRTTLDIDDDVRRAAKTIAAQRNISAGAVISELVREALTDHGGRSERIVMNGIRVVPPTGKAVTSELVRELHEANA